MLKSHQLITFSIVSYLLIIVCNCHNSNSHSSESSGTSFIPDVASKLKYSLDDTILYLINWITKPAALTDAALTKQVEGPSTVVGNNDVTTSVPTPPNYRQSVNQMNDRLKSVIEAAEKGISPDIFTLNEENEREELTNMVSEKENIVWIKTNRQETYYCTLPVLKHGQVTAVDVAYSSRGASNVDSITQVKPELTSENAANAPATTSTLPAGTTGESTATPADGSFDSFDEKEPNIDSPYAMLKSIYNREVCSYRLDFYWTYELCHGRFLRQFHEASVVLKAKQQQYFLGKYSMTEYDKTEAEFMAKIARYKSEGKKLPSVIVEGVSMPYIEFNYTGGTLCNLNNRERVTRVLYVCSENSKHELHSVKEIYTCEYEAIVLSPILCLHQDFRVSQDKEHPIKCYPVGTTQAKPVDVAKFDAELADQEAKAKATSKENFFSDARTLFYEHEISPGLKVKLTTFKEPDDEYKEVFDKLANTESDRISKSSSNPSSSSSSSSSSNKRGQILKSHKQNPGSPPFEVPDDSSLVAEFFAGDLCLRGGSGWWKYEFCFGKHVEQYHEEKGERTSAIRLGKWIPKNHLKWLADNPEKRPAKGKTPKVVYNYYSEGDPCVELNGRPRHVEVKLKCKYIQQGAPDSVAIYLIEPQTCEYVLGVESPIFCRLFNNVDENGQIEH